MLHLEVERRLLEHHKDGILSNSILDDLLPNSKPHGFESFLFDYKHYVGQDKSSTDEVRRDNAIRDICAFHNSMGGYIINIFDIAHTDAAIYKFLTNNDELNQRISGYLGYNIGVRILSTPHMVEGQTRDVIIAYIPKRAIAQKPRPFRKNSNNIGSNDKPAYVINKGLIYCRYEHECRPANQDIELLNFVYSDREPSPVFKLATQTENNLPPRDPSLIQFVGRRTYLEALWRWIAEPRRPIKVLSAAGGLGKTTVAYEFATQLLDRPGAGFEKIVWLSGKKITFAALLGKLVSTTRCDFENIDDLLSNCLIQVGFTEEEVKSTEDREEKITKCIEAFSTLSILLIIDDVDSLPKEEQNNLYSVISQIIIAANVVNDNSRVLFTSRLELLTGQEQRIAMAGFDGKDFEDYLVVNLAYMIDDESQKKQIINSKNKILAASAGSPIFITSIVRLVSLGHDLARAVADWRGKNGEQIRSFAFEKEIDQLSATQREILYAMQLLSRARIEEIKEICSLTSVELESDLATLKDYHLYATKGDPVAGTILEVPEPIRLMHDITQGKILEAKRREIERACFQAKRQSEDPARRIALIISQTVRHWKNGDYDVAERYLTDEIANYNKTGELYCLRGRTRLSVRGRKPSDIERDFESAEKYGCNEFDLLKYWYVLKIRSKDWRGIYNLSVRKSDVSQFFPALNCAHVFATIRIAERSQEGGDSGEALQYFEEALSLAFTYIDQGRATGYFHQMRSLMHEAAVGALNSIARSFDVQRRRLEAFRFVVSCLKFRYAPSYFLWFGFNALDEFVGLSRGLNRNERNALLDDLVRLKAYLASQDHHRAALSLECDRLTAKLR